MKKGLLIPAALLGAILAFCLWNGAAMSAHTARWRAQLEEADRLVLLEDWQGAAAAIRAAYAGWTERQTYLHCVTGHFEIPRPAVMVRLGDLDSHFLRLPRDCRPVLSLQ